MANLKTGLAYYNVDTNRYQDIRIKRLKKDFGCDGIAVYDYLLCEIYRDKGCFLVWDDSTAFDVAEYFGLKENTVKEIVNYCSVVGLFDKGLLTYFSILTSIDIQKKWIRITLKVDFEIQKKDYLLIDPSEIAFYKTNRNPRLHERNYKLWRSISAFVFKRDKYTCKYCHKKGEKLEVDHIFPVSKGGSDELYNLTTSCQKCNRQKNNKTIKEFIEWRNNHGKTN